jgi:hypothetical protein
MSREFVFFDSGFAVKVTARGNDDQHWTMNISGSCGPFSFEHYISEPYVLSYDSWMTILADDAIVLETETRGGAGRGTTTRVNVTSPQLVQLLKLAIETASGANLKFAA